jgi:pimeloyl-ACP methyl ester carboxylesterase
LRKQHHAAMMGRSCTVPLPGTATYLLTDNLPTDYSMESFKHAHADFNGIRMHYVEAGAGPVVLLCHGWPESWYSWRHQLRALAEAGYRAVAPDMRGYGGTEAPEQIERYTIMHLVGDMVGLLDSLGQAHAVIVGHDWGAPVAWHAALMRPDRFRAVAGLSVPFTPRSSTRPTSVMPSDVDTEFYQLYFQHPGVAEREFDQDPARAIRTLLVGGSGDAPRRTGDGPRPPAGMASRTHGWLACMPQPGPTLPGWINETDIAFYASEFTRSGFSGGFNWYRNIDRNWELMAVYAGAKITVPALFMAGDRDMVLAFPGMQRIIEHLNKSVPQLRKTILVPGCGHWIQQERPTEVNTALIEFLRSL